MIKLNNLFIFTKEMVEKLRIRIKVDPDGDVWVNNKGQHMGLIFRYKDGRVGMTSRLYHFCKSQAPTKPL